MPTCCCSMAGTLACVGCGNRAFGVYTQPMPQLLPETPIDYEKLATMIAEKLKVKA